MLISMNTCMYTFRLYGVKLEHMWIQRYPMFNTHTCIYIYIYLFMYLFVYKLYYIMYPYSIHHTPEKKKPFFADFTCRCSPHRIRGPSIAPSQAPLVGGVVTHLGASHGFYPPWNSWIQQMISNTKSGSQGFRKPPHFMGKAWKEQCFPVDYPAILQNSQWRFSKKYRRRDLTSPNPGHPKVPVMPISSKNTLPKIPKKNDDVFMCLPDRKKSSTKLCGEGPPPESLCPPVGRRPKRSPGRTWLLASPEVPRAIGKNGR